MYIVKGIEEQWCHKFSFKLFSTNEQNWCSIETKIGKVGILFKRLYIEWLTIDENVL